MATDTPVEGLSSSNRSRPKAMATDTPVEGLSSSDRSRPKATAKRKKDQSKPRHRCQPGNNVMEAMGQREQVRALASGTGLEMTDGHAPTVMDEKSPPARSRGPPPGFGSLPVASPQASSSQQLSDKSGGGRTRREGGRREGGQRRERCHNWQQGNGGRSHGGWPQQEEGHREDRHRPRRPHHKERGMDDRKKPPAVDLSAEPESRHSSAEWSQNSRPQATNRRQHQRQRIAADARDFQPRDRDGGRRKEGGGRESGHQRRPNRQQTSVAQNGSAKFGTDSRCPQNSSAGESPSAPG